MATLELMYAEVPETQQHLDQDLEQNQDQQNNHKKVEHHLSL